MRTVVQPPPFAYSQYFPSLSYPDHLQHTHHQEFFMHNDQFLSQSMTSSSLPSTPIDPWLALNPLFYQQHPSQIQQHPNHSSPSSQASGTIGTPPAEIVIYPSFSNINGKRPTSSISDNNMDSRKKGRTDDECDNHTSTTQKEEVKAKPTRGSRACIICRRLKMKCVGAEQGLPCKRCSSGNHECIFEESNRGNKKITRSLRRMERTLDTVLRSIGNPGIASGVVSRSPSPSPQTVTTQASLAKSSSPPPASSTFRHQPNHRQPLGSPKLHSLPDNSLNPSGVLAEANLASSQAQEIIQSGPVAIPTDPSENPKLGPMTILPLRRQHQVQPEMLNFVGTDEVVILFNIYFDNIHMHCNLLDRNFHTLSLVCARSSFLLTTICSIASKFYAAKPYLHSRLTELAKRLAFSVLAKGYKSVEIVQAYLMLALWGCGDVERYERDRSWLLLGMAIRMATDLNLHRKTAMTGQNTREGKARDFEIRNRERTWILCFCLDRSFSAQIGKPSSIKEDYIIQHANEWYGSSMANPSDFSLAAYAELQRILSRSLEFLCGGTESASGLLVNCDYMVVIKSFEMQIMTWKQQWINRRNWENQPPAASYKRVICQFYFNYAMLVLNSFGLQNAMERASLDIGHFFARVHSSALACAMIVRDQLGPSGFMKYSPDSHFVQISYAVLSLLKLVRPEFQAFLKNEHGILRLVKEVANVLDNIAAHPLHTPALHSRFLRALIAARWNLPLSNSGSNGDGDKNFQLPVDGEESNDTQGDKYTPRSDGQQQCYGQGTSFLLNEFQFDSEMGPVADISTLPPIMAPYSSKNSMGGAEHILNRDFWDSMLVPGTSSDQFCDFSGGGSSSLE